MSRGVLYVGTGEKFFDQAVESARSVSDTNSLPCAIITNKRLAATKRSEVFEEVIVLDDPYDDVRDKIYNLTKSPFEKTLFLDGDTLVLEDISSIFTLLDRVDIAAAYATGRYKVHMEDIPDCLPELNTAILAYDMTSDETVEMLSLWEELQKRQVQTGRPLDGEKIPVANAETLEEASRFGNLYGQTTFREAVYKSSVSYSILPPEYNYGKTGRGYARYDVKILHGDKRFELLPIINKRNAKRQLVGNILYYPSSGEKVRVTGRPIIDTLSKRVQSKIGDVSRKIGIYPIVKHCEQRLRN